jgi:hypothetical protein
MVQQLVDCPEDIGIILGIVVPQEPHQNPIVLPWHIGTSKSKVS